MKLFVPLRIREIESRIASWFPDVRILREGRASATVASGAPLAAERLGARPW
jgi:hypothetical protein